MRVVLRSNTVAEVARDGRDVEGSDEGPRHGAVRETDDTGIRETREEEGEAWRRVGRWARHLSPCPLHHSPSRSWRAKSPDVSRAKAGQMADKRRVFLSCSSYVDIVQQKPSRSHSIAPLSAFDNSSRRTWDHVRDGDVSGIASPGKLPPPLPPAAVIVSVHNHWCASQPAWRRLINAQCLKHNSLALVHISQTPP